MSADKVFEETFKFLEEGDNKIEPSKYKNVNLVVGNSGSGKSTFTEYIVGDNTQLFSVKVGGNFIFQDSNNDTSSSSVSKTIFPKLYDDESSKSAFYDCPGFSDNRNASMDIASTYFIKKVIESAENIKFILTASYSDLKMTNDRAKNFKLLLEHMSSLVQNVETYKDSFSLIATKVSEESTYDEDGERIGIKTDAQQINEIGSFFIQLKSELHESSPFSSDKFLLGNSTILLDALSTNINDNFQRIGLFKVPTKAGPVSEIKPLQKAKIPILKIFNENTKFVPMNPNDFGYTVSDASKNEIKNLAANLNKKVEVVTIRIADQIKKHYRNKINESEDFHELERELDDDFNVLDIESIKNKKINDLIVKLTIIKETLGINISNPDLSKLRSYSEYFDFFESLSREEIKKDSLEWIEPLRDTMKYVNNLKLTYKFLVDLFEYLGSYNIQKDTTKYNVYDLNDWGSEGKKQGIEITERKWKTFLHKVNLGAYSSVLNDEIDDRELNILNEVLKVTLKGKITTACLNNKLMMKGDFVKLSEISKTDCKNALNIEILALNTVFIDQDMEKIGKKQKLSIIAPKWKIVDTKKINVDGVPATEHNVTKASNNDDNGGRGSDGVPGLPGGVAGSIFGIGNEFYGDKSLTITANGGIGSNGQDGGDGGNGKDGSTPKFRISRREVRKNEKIDICFQDAIDYTIVYDGKESWANTGKIRFTDTLYRVHANKCIAGGNGGDGGSFGEGGHEGEIHIVGLKQIPEFSTSNVKGKNGSDGVGGKGGSGSKSGDDQTVKFRKYEQYHSSFGPPMTWYIGCDHIETIKNDNCAVGQPGKTGLVTKNKKNPENKVTIENISNLINSYKVFLQNNAQNNVRKSILKNFLRELNENQKILDLYDTLGLVDELKQMENELFKVRYEIDLIPIYENLLKRVLNYSKNPKNDEKTNEHKKVLSFLYSATLSKICAIREDWKHNLITDLEGYLNAAINSINDLKEANTVAAIGNLNKNYKGAVDDKIKEANVFIEDQISREIDNIETQIESNIDDLIEESLEIQEATRNQTHELILKQSELQNKMQIESAFSVVKSIGKGLSLIGPWGAAAGTIIDASASIAESLAMDDDAASKAVKIPKAAQEILETIKERVKNFQDEKLKVLEKQKEILASEEAAGASEELKNLNDLIIERWNNATTILDNNESDEDAIQVLEVDWVEGQLEVEEKQLKEKKTDKAKLALKVIKKLKTAAKLVQIGSDLYEKYHENEKKIKEAEKAIDDSRAELKRMKLYHETIYSILIPMINKMKRNIANLESDVPSKSLVALDVTKWQIQASLKSLKNELRSFTEDFSIQKDLLENIDKLVETINTLIQIFDRIQNYKEQKLLADYIANINSASATDVVINDEKLKAAVDNLKVVIKSNIVLSEYENIISGVKQFIFPFVGMYLDEFQLPSDLDWFKSNKELADAAVNKIKKLKEKLIKTSVTVTKHDKYIFSGDFKKPFFVWKNEAYRDSFRKLLSGEEISLKADVTRGIDVNAVKFNTIDILFKSKNASLEEELNRILEANYQLQMIHMGNSYYRCQNKTYFIPSQQQEISFTFEKNNQSQPRVTSEPYRKIKDGNPMLSPYAMWKIKIFMAPTYSLDNPLSRLADEVDLHLVGSGQYVKNEYECSDVGLEEFLDSPSIQTKLLIEEEDKKKRSIRSTNYAHNSAAGFSSHINKIFKSMKNAFVGFQESLGGGQNYVGSTFEPKETLKQISPVNFFNQVDSVLVLAPVLHHFWKSFFNQKSSNDGEVSFIQISKERVKIWDNFMLQAEKVVKILREEFGENQSEVNEYEEALSVRKSEFDSIISQTEIEDQKVEEFERNLVAFEVDLVDDLDYNENFSKIRKNQEFQFVMKKLFESAQVLPNFSRNYKLVKPNYEALSQNNDLMFEKEMQGSSFNQIYSDVGHIFNRQNLCISEGSRFEMLRQVN